MNNHVKYDLCPIIVYTSFKSFDNGKMANCTSIVKFESDMKKLIDNGYEAISLAQINECRKSKKSLPNKSFCIVFLGGYIDNYSIAYPVIKKLGLHVDIFIATDLVGLNTYPGIENFIPHFSWEQANEMHRSGLVDIYAFWHPFDEKKADKEAVIREKIHQIASNIENSDPKVAFYIGANNVEDENKIMEIFRDIGISLNLIGYLFTTQERLNNGILPYIGINHESNIFDIIDSYTETCYSLIKREESIIAQNDCIKWSGNDYESVLLPIDKNPLIKNYQRHAFPLSVLAADRKDKAEMFVLNEYIDVVFRPWYHYFDYDNHLYDSWDCITCCRLNRETIMVNKINVVDCVLNGLNMGYYSDLWLDTYYIPGKPDYGSLHLSHGLLVYGYDKTANKFTTLTYTQRGQYERLDVAPDDILRACSNDYFLWLNLFKSNKCSQVNYRKDMLIKKLKKYINSDYDLDNTKYNKYDSNQLCNFKACQAFPDYIYSIGIKEKKIYLVALYGFIEHKKCMAWRLDFIAKHENVEKQKIHEFLNYTNAMHRILLNLGLKYNSTKKDKILQHIVDIASEMNNKEKDAILCLISTLDNS